MTRLGLDNYSRRRISFSRLRWLPKPFFFFLFGNINNGGVREGDRVRIYFYRRKSKLMRCPTRVSFQVDTLVQQRDGQRRDVYSRRHRVLEIPRSRGRTAPVSGVRRHAPRTLVEKRSPDSHTGRRAQSVRQSAQVNRDYRRISDNLLIEKPPPTKKSHRHDKS